MQSRRRDLLGFRLLRIEAIAPDACGYAPELFTFQRWSARDRMHDQAILGQFTRGVSTLAAMPFVRPWESRHRLQS